MSIKWEGEFVVVTVYALAELSEEISNALPEPLSADVLVMLCKEATKISKPKGYVFQQLCQIGLSTSYVVFRKESGI